MVHSSGGPWSTVAGIPTTVALNAVWASSASDVWAVGLKGTAIHYNGSAWTSSSTPTAKNLQGLWGTGPGNVWAVGDVGTALHFDGTSWASVSTPTSWNLMGVWGSAASDIWATGLAALVLHYDGSSWSDIGGFSGDTYYSVSGRSASEAWIVGRRGAAGSNDPIALEYNGSSWAKNSPPVTGQRLFGVWVSPTGKTWAVGDTYPTYSGQIHLHNGTSWTAQSPPSTGTLYGVWGTSDCDVWAVGAGGAILHFGP